MEWKFVKELKNKDTIQEFQSIVNQNLPRDYVDFIKNYNGGRPNLKLFKTITGKEHVIKTFLSFNHDDIENIFKVNSWLKKEFGDIYFAIASDPAGNYIVFNKKYEIYFWNHELNEVQFVQNSFQSFIKELY
ncbi:SMI1/KNR4 family protein [Cetobacterium sp.]|uniref:SMI1/KNR4 family protein n=1 Tax=Cetobacterium sp. TaxID=2071632 RepID=UPI003F373DB2